MINPTIVIQELKRIRREAGFTQAEVAERMHTKQEVISRMEKDTRGSFSLKRIADYALACGYAPCNLCDIEKIRAGVFSPEFHCIPLEEAMKFLIADPKKEMTWRNYVAWKAAQILEELGPPQRYAHTNTLRVAS